MATKGGSPVEDNPKKRARENSEKLMDEMEIMQKLCKRICRFDRNSEMLSDHCERFNDVTTSLATMMPKLFEQITLLQTEVEDLKTENTASVVPKFTEQITVLQAEVEDLKTQNLELKTEIADLKI